MNTNINLDSVEKSIYRYYWEDGLLDLLLGVGLALTGLAWLSGLFALTMVVPLLLLPIWISVRKNVTVPRAGHVLFSSEQTLRTRQKLNISSLIGFALLTLFGALYAFMKSDPAVGGEWVEFLGPSLPTALLAIVLLVAYITFAVPRLPLHASIVLAVAIGGIAQEVEPGWQFLIAGIVIAGIGITYFVKFLRDFPEPDKQSSEITG